MKMLNVIKPPSIPQWAYVLFMLLSLALAPLLYNLPLVGLGIGDINKVQHFSAEERLFIDFHGQYDKGPLYAPPFDNMNVYPKAYYNLAGLFLYPYASINGSDFQTVLVTWRLLNTIAGAGAIIVLFFIGRRVFRSDAIAFVGAILFGITPEFLLWTSSVRPNPLELLLVLATLLFCIRLFECFSYKTFLMAAILASLSFSTKYGGVLFLALLPLVALFVIWQSQRNRDTWIEPLLQQMRMIRWALPILVIFTAFSGAVFVLLLMGQNWDPVALIMNVSASSFPADKLARAPAYLERWRWLVQAVAFLGIATIVLTVVVLLVAWRVSRNWAKTNSHKATSVVYVFLTVWLAIQVILIYGLAFFVTGPVYIARPDFFVSQVGFLLYYTSLGGDVGPFGQASPFIEHFRTLVSQLHPGWLGFPILLGIAIYREIFQIPRSHPQKAIRIFLWVFIASSVIVMLVSSQIQLRHVLPAIAISSLFIGDSLVALLKAFNPPRLHVGVRTAGVVAVLLLVLLAGFHVHSAYANWSIKFSKNSDTGIMVGDWLIDQYPYDVRLMTDWWTFYVPPQFTNVATTTTAERAATREGAIILESGVPIDSFDPSVLKKSAVRESILEFDPEVIIISHPDGYDTTVNVLSLLESDPALSELGYKEIRRFDYVGNKARLYEYTEVLVFEKN